MRRHSSSRVSRLSEKRNKKQTTYFTLGIIIIIFLLFQFGPMIINIFGNIVYSLRGDINSNNSQINGDKLLLPPTLFDVPQATQSSTITFSGSAPDKKGVVEVYVNDELKDEIDIVNNVTFSVKNIILKKGFNSIKSRFVKNEKTSAFSEDITVNYLTSKPKLVIQSPQDGEEFKKADKNITVKGTTDPENTITVNSFRAIVEGNGDFEYVFQLNDGQNQILIEAKNLAGISTQKQINVIYTP